MSVLMNLALMSMFASTCTSSLVFGIKATSHPKSPTQHSTEKVTLTLRWSTYQYQCSVFPKTDDTYYNCDTSNATSNTRKCDTLILTPNVKQYSLQIDVKGINPLQIDSILIQQHSNLKNIHIIDHFYFNSKTINVLTIHPTINNHKLIQLNGHTSNIQQSAACNQAIRRKLQGTITTTNQNPVCIDGNFHSYGLNGIYRWQYYDSTLKGSVYYCAECRTSNGVYLFPWINSNNYFWQIYDTTNTNTAHSFCRLGIGLGTNYEFNINDCSSSSWETWDFSSKVPSWTSDYLTAGDCIACITGNSVGGAGSGSYLNGYYIWSYYSSSLGGDVFYCATCNWNSGAYLYPQTLTSSTYWKIGPDDVPASGSWSYCQTHSISGENPWVNLLTTCDGNWQSYLDVNGNYEWTADSNTVFMCTAPDPTPAPTTPPPTPSPTPLPTPAPVVTPTTPPPTPSPTPLPTPAPVVTPTYTTQQTLSPTVFSILTTLTPSPIVFTTTNSEVHSTITQLPPMISSTNALEQHVVKAFAKEPIFTTYTVISALVIGTFLSVVIVSLFHATCFNTNDFYQAGALIAAMLQMQDMVSDIFFALDVQSKYSITIGDYKFQFVIIFVASIICIIFPIIICLIQLYHATTKHWMNDAKIRGWLSEYSKLLYFTSVVTGSSFSAVEIFNCNMFSLDLFDMGLSKKHSLSFHTKRVYSIILFENIPQVILQIWYSILGEFNLITAATMTFSFISIIVTVISMCITRKIYKSQNYLSISIDVTGKAVIDNVSVCKNKIFTIRHNISNMLGINERLIEIKRPFKIPNGLKVEIDIPINDALMEGNINKYKQLIMNSKQDGGLQKFIRNAWSLNDIPNVDNVMFEFIECRLDTKSNESNDNPYKHQRIAGEANDMENDANSEQETIHTDDIEMGWH